METRYLGHSGLEVSVVGLGCNNFGGMVRSLDLDASRKVIHAALDAGITLFDTSDSYGTNGGSETTLGEILGDRRKDVVLATKFASPMNREKSTRRNGSRGYIMRAVEDSLRRLKTDWIDLYQYHFPDPNTPVEETMRALDDLVRQGKVRYLGCSNLAAWQLVDAAWTARHFGTDRLLSTQAEYSLLARDTETDLFPALNAARMTLLPYFPLASGLLTGKYRKGQPTPDSPRAKYFAKQFSDERSLNAVEELISLAQEAGMSITHMAMAFVMAHPGVTSALLGPRTMQHLDDLLAGAEVRLSEDVLDRIDQIVPPGIDVGLNQANYMPPALVTPALRRRPQVERAAA